MIVIIVGESASGKSTLAAKFEEYSDYTKVVTYTTRPPRAGEQNGIDYYFVTDDEFNQMVKDDKFVEHASYRGWQYGTAINFDKNNDKIIVLTPAGARAFRAYANKHPKLRLELYVFYLFVDRRSRLIKLLTRGDDIEEAYRRSLSDVGQFDAFEREADYVIYNEEYLNSPDDVYEEAIIKINDWKYEIAKNKYE